jgi:hypothetical protein
MKHYVMGLSVLGVVSCAHDAAEMESAQPPESFVLTDDIHAQSEMIHDNASMPQPVNGVVSPEWRRRDVSPRSHTGRVCQTPSAELRLGYTPPLNTNPCTAFGCGGESGEDIISQEYMECPTPDGDTMQRRGYSYSGKRTTYIRFPDVSELWYALSFEENVEGKLGFDVGDAYVYVLSSSERSNLSMSIYRHEGQCAQGTSEYERYLDNLSYFKKFERIDIVHRSASRHDSPLPEHQWWFAPARLRLGSLQQREWVRSFHTTDFFDKTTCYPPQDVDTIHEVVFPTALTTFTVRDG